MPELEWSGLEELKRAVGHLPELALNAAEPAMLEAILFQHEQLPEYPPSSTESFAPDGWSFASDAQRKFFFGAVKAGQILGWAWVKDQVMGKRGKLITDQHPQKIGSGRTGTLGRKWTEKVRRDKSSVTGVLGTNVPYAPWVVGPDYPGEHINGKQMYQARVHQRRWWQLYGVFDENAAAAWDVFEDAFFEQLRKEWENEKSSKPG